MARRPFARRTDALARARARKRSAGAAMFIVAVTLGVLAVMGAYGLSATASDIRAAGHFREAAQGQAAAEHAVMLTAETFTPGTAGELVKAMQAGRSGAGTDVQTTTCRTAKPFTGDKQFQTAEACLSLSMLELKNINAGTNAWINIDTTYGTFSPKDSNGSSSFGQVTDIPFLRIEVTNPVDIPPPPGTGLSDRYTFTQVTATVFVEMKPGKNDAANLVAQGRGRLTVGPYYR